jgi:hypothetical protein
MGGIMDNFNERYDQYAGACMTIKSLQKQIAILEDKKLPELTEQDFKVSKIAEFYGFSDIKKIGVGLVGTYGGIKMVNVPDYFGSFDALFLLEQIAWGRNWLLRDVFVDKLANILNPIFGYRMREIVDFLDATPQERAEAFYQAITTTITQ